MLLNFFLKILGDSIFWKVIILLASIKLFISNIPTVPDSALEFALVNESDLKEMINSSEELKESMNQISKDTLFNYIEASFHRYWIGNVPKYYYCSSKNKLHFYSENETKAISFSNNCNEEAWINNYRDSIDNPDTLYVLDSFFTIKDSFMKFTLYGCNPFLRYQEFTDNPIVEKYIVLYYKKNHYILVKAPDTKRIEFELWLESLFKGTIEKNSELPVCQDWTLYCFKENTFFYKAFGYGE
jgi:hypothetical protein